jgi:RNA polymerase sigma-70 factor (ECF subfamily)
LKLLGAATHAPSNVTSVAGVFAASRERIEFDRIYEMHFSEVERWIRALGGPGMELEDLAQEVFIVVRRKLDAFDGRNLRGWLFRITALTVSDHRRRSWFKHLFLRRSHVELETIDCGRPSPSEALERREDERRVHRLLARMSEKRRVAFTLFEINGYTGEEIAGLLDIPLKTVWTRLHHARREFVAMVRGEEERGGR